jgi:hypothetical protein
MTHICPTHHPRVPHLRREAAKVGHFRGSENPAPFHPLKEGSRFDSHLSRERPNRRPSTRMSRVPHISPLRCGVSSSEARTVPLRARLQPRHKTGCPIHNAASSRHEWDIQAKLEPTIPLFIRAEPKISSLFIQNETPRLQVRQAFRAWPSRQHAAKR